jgi:aminoglycoside 3-N-acetyltransferase I
MAYIYKQLTSSDTGLMQELLGVFGEAFGEEDTYIRKQSGEEYLKRLLLKEDFIALVAKDEAGRVVGGLAAYVLEKFEQERKEIYIYDLAVAEPNRKQGVASALIEKLKEIAKMLGAYVIFVQADDGDEAAIALYEKFGKKEAAFQFDILTS